MTKNIRRYMAGATSLGIAGVLACTGTAAGQSSTTKPPPPPPPPVGGNVPAGMIAYFTAPGSGSSLECPDGWSQYTNGQGRMILGTTTAGGAEAMNNGTPVTTNAEEPTHAHPFTATWSLDKHKSLGGSGGYKPFASSGNQSGGGTTSGGWTGYGYIQYLICESPAATPPQDDTPAGTIAYFTNAANGGNCPAGWGFANSMNGYFPMAVSPNSPAVGTTYNSPWSITSSTANSFPTHTHSSGNIGQFTLEVLGVDQGEGSSGAKAMANPVPVTASLQANTTDVVPAISLLACQKTDMGSLTPAIPLGIALFYSVPNACPISTWGPAVGSPGRFIIGIAGSDTVGPNSLVQGQTINGTFTPGSPSPSHTHPVPITADLGENTTNHGSGSTTNYGKGGDNSMTGTSTSATIDIPYVALTLCQVQ